MTSMTPMLGAPEWVPAATVLLIVAGAALLWGYWRAPASKPVCAAAASLKAVALAALAFCLVEPLWSGLRPRRGANVLAIAADNSQSLQIRDQGNSAHRGQLLQRRLLADSSWQNRLAQDFDVRRFQFDTQLQAIKDFSQLTSDGSGSSLAGALASISRRFRGLPIAGVLMFTDGNATDNFADDFAWANLPPVYPIVVGSGDPPQDIRVEHVSVGQTNFETAPVVIRADIVTVGYNGKSIVAKLYDEDGTEVQSQTARLSAGEDRLSLRFQLRPDNRPLSFYRIRVLAEGATFPEANGNAAAWGTASPAGLGSNEATLANNERIVVVDRGGGPYRILYVCGRPNWEFKFLRRALAGDDQLDLVGLVRIARSQPKFTFRDRGTQSTNQLFKGFDHPDKDTAERYDEPVLVRLGTVDEHELHDGFPRTADELYRYHAIVLDDVEAEFFTHDQLSLIESFISRRGGGFLMLGGEESFLEGGYRRTPIADLLPVYLVDAGDGASLPVEHKFRMALTREGWLQPWVRLRKTESEERQRLAAMEEFRSLNLVGSLKPGATVLAHALDQSGKTHPALVAQRFGSGRSAALLLGDLWRWGIRRQNDQESDLEKSWRQTVRWLVASVPQRVEADVKAGSDATANSKIVRVRVRDTEYLPLENASVAVHVTAPDGKSMELNAQPSDKQAGEYVARYVSRLPGAYRAAVTARAPDSSPIGNRDIGWVAQPLADEFNRLQPNRQLLDHIAAQTGGQVVELDEVAHLADGLYSSKVPITEPWTGPLWHHPLLFVLTIVCLTAEWGLRRWKGLA